MVPFLENQAVQLSANNIVVLSIVASIILFLMWCVFWYTILQSKNITVLEVLSSQGFFRTVAVMGVIAATAVLGLAGRLESNITGAILSGVGGFVLGHISGRGQESGGPVPAGTAMTQTAPSERTAT